MHFFQQFDFEKEYVSYEYGANWWFDSEDYGDLARAMCESFELVKKQIYEDLHQQSVEKYREALKSTMAHLKHLEDNAP